MTCAACAARVEKGLHKLVGVEQANVNLATETATVEYLPGQLAVDDLIKAVSRIGYGARPVSDLSAAAGAGEDSIELKQKLRRLLFAAALSLPFLLMMVGEFLGLTLPGWLTSFTTQFLLATPVQFIAGWPFYRGAFASLRSGSANMDVLVALGTSAAYFYSLGAAYFTPHTHLYFEVSAMLITLILLGKYLEALAKGGLRKPFGS